MDKQGLFNKYEVVKHDGLQDPNAEYFVLRIDSDPHARKAALVYAESIQEENPNLAVDIYAQVAKHEGGIIKQSKGNDTTTKDTP